MNKKIIKISLFMIIFVFVLTLSTKIVFAGDTLNPTLYHATLKYDDASYIFGKGAIIVKLLRNIAAVVAVLTLSIIGFRYMIGSVEQKAEYKQTMMPVVIGCILVASLAGILTIVQSIF